MNFYQQRLANLRDLGFRPKVIYDIGAAFGTWTDQTEEIFPNSQFYLFEANRNKTDFLEKKKHPFFIEVLGDQEGPTIFYSSKMEGQDGGGDSVFRENSTLYSDQNCEAQHLQMTRLSSLVKKHQLPQPDMIKMDVQGAEKIVILGGIDIVAATEIVILETQLIQYNQGAALFLEIANLMDILGFQIIDLVNVQYIITQSCPESMIHLEVMFVRKNSKLKRTGILF